MSKIIKLEGTEVYIGMDDQKIVKAPISAVNYPNPQVGDEIRIFKDGDTTIIARAAAAAPAVPQPQPQSVVEFVVFCVVLWVAFWLALRVLQFWVLFCSLVLRAICGYSFQNQKSNLGPGSTGSANSLPSLAADMQNGG